MKQLLGLFALSLVACSGTAIDASQTSKTSDDSAMAAPDVSADAVPVTTSHPRVLQPLSNPVPTLVFEGICDGACTERDYASVSKSEFRTILVRLNRLGYVTLSADDFVRYTHGERKGLPEKPVFITFDHGRRDAYHGADDVLQETGNRATMFVLTDRANVDSHYMSWEEMSDAQASGRWDIQLNGHASYSTVDAEPFLLHRLPGETFDAWRIRVENDMVKGTELLTQHVPGFRSRLYAVPFGNYGQYLQDPSTAIELGSFFNAAFEGWFTEKLPNPDYRKTLDGERVRYVVKASTTAEDVQTWLRAAE